ncbi:MAG: ATP-binding protein [Planctomycetota bacterium]
MADPIPYEPEGPECEWKELLPRRERIAKTLAAFANGCGGSLWIGVRDSGEAVGVSDPRFVERTLLEVADGLVQPRPALEFRRHLWHGRTLVELRVAADERRPFAAVTIGGDLRVYVRDGSSTRPAAEHTVRALGRGPARAFDAALDPRARRLLQILRERREPTLSELARCARIGRRAARRLLVPLVRSGLIAETDRHRLWLTPLGHRSA